MSLVAEEDKMSGWLLESVRPKQTYRIRRCSCSGCYPLLLTSPWSTRNTSVVEAHDDG
jgi:hypothetical protein